MYTDFFADGRPRITGLNKMCMCGKYNQHPFQKWPMEDKLVVTNSHMPRPHFCCQMWRELPYSSCYSLTESSCKTAREGDNHASCLLHISYHKNNKSK
jgi:hypothetical protein